MKNYIRAAAGMMLVAIVFFVSAAYATVGSWLNGKLTASPWHEDGYLYVQVDDVRYTIMDEVQVKLVHMKNGVTVKDPANKSDLHEGDSVAVQHSGNRIYAVEINR